MNVVGGGGLVGLLVNVVGCLLGLVVVVKLFFWLVTKPIQKVPCPPPLKEEREEKGKERTEKDGEVCLVTGGGGLIFLFSLIFFSFFVTTLSSPHCPIPPLIFSFTSTPPTQLPW